MKFTPNKSINTVITYSKYTLSYAAMLAFLMAKPPVPAVENAFTTLSNSGMPPKNSSVISSSVNTI